jgi:hypothetical protein
LINNALLANWIKLLENEWNTSFINCKLIS